MQEEDSDSSCSSVSNYYSTDSSIERDNFARKRQKTTSVVTASSNSTFTTITLSNSVQRQLLQDLELAGGVSCSLKRVCDQKPDIYGTPASKLRKVVSNLVSTWRRLSPESYDQLLTQHQAHHIRNYANTKTRAPIPSIVTSIPFQNKKPSPSTPFPSTPPHPSRSSTSHPHQGNHVFFASPTMSTAQSTFIERALAGSNCCKCD